MWAKPSNTNLTLGGALVALAVAAALLTPTPSRPVAAQDAETPNILLLIADDFGVESSVCYDDAPLAAPRLAAFCQQGVVYDNAWSSPICSPTRAGIMTGRHSFRTSIGEPTSPQNGLVLDESEYTLPEVLDLADSGYATGSFGKWHLGGGRTRPNDMGWDHYSGLIQGGLSDYEDWSKVTNGSVAPETTYATTANVDDALAWIGDQSDPWFTWIGFNAPHTPFHVPPSNLHTQAIDENSSDEAKYAAAVEALDTEIGRLVDSLDPVTLANTVIIFMGDNGTPGQVSEFPRGQAKGSVRNGGIHVPMFVWGAGVEGERRSDALVGTVDIFATVLELAGVDTSTVIPSDVELDAVSFAPTLTADVATNEYLLSEVFGPTTSENVAGKAIRNQDYKLIELDSGTTLFYDLRSDPTAVDPIAPAARSQEDSDAFDELSGVLADWTASVDAPRPAASDPPPTPTPTPTTGPVDDGVHGDVNCDDALTIVDALLIAQFSVGNRTAADCPLPNPLNQVHTAYGDYDSDGSINIVDALLVSRCVVQIGCLEPAGTDWVFDSSYTRPAEPSCPVGENFLDLTKFDGAGAAYPDPSMSISCDASTFTVSGNGIPHTPFVLLTNRDLETQNYNNTIPLTPVRAAAPTQIGAEDGANPTLGTIGVAVNGIPFYGPTEAAQPDPWGDPLVNGIIDNCGGHHWRHHYHAMVTSCFAPDWDPTKPAPILGYAYDGYPIYGSTGCLDLSCDQVVEFKSGWDVVGDTSTFAWDNVNFVADRGPEYLDECNGRTQPDGSYGYHATSTFPYLIGCFMGEVTLPARGGG